MTDRKVLATFGAGPMKPVLRLVLPTFEAYASKHGYDLVVGTGHEASPRPHSWSKIPLFRQLLQTYESLLWVDGDALIRRMDVDIADLVPSDCWQALVEIHDAHGEHVNLGVWFMRAAQQSFSFLEHLWSSHDLIDHPWWENAAALRALGYSLAEPLQRAHDSPWWEGTFLLPSEFNSLSRHAIPNPRIIHYSGVSNRERARLIRQQRGLPPNRFEDGKLRLAESERIRQAKRLLTSPAKLSSIVKR